MKSFPRSAAVASALLATTPPFATAAAPMNDQLSGIWLTEDRQSVVRFAPCAVRRDDVRNIGRVETQPFQ